jgi:hypothetical protein
MSYADRNEGGKAGWPRNGEKGLGMAPQEKKGLAFIF